MANKYVVGGIFTNNQGYEAKIIERNKEKATIKFLVSGWTKEVYASDIGRGKFKDKYAPSIYGVGIVGEERTQTQPYRSWLRMLERCYSGRHTSYRNTTVHPDWLYFPNFKQWYESNITLGWELDKDLKQPGLIHKVYSEATCCFLPPKINAALVKPLSLGVTVRGVDTYIAQLKRDNKTFNLGSFGTKEEAISCYKRERHKYLYDLAAITKESDIQKLLCYFADYYFKE